MNWTKERPTKEGWYFWRKSKVQSDPWKWNTYFIVDEGEDSRMTDMQGDPVRFTCWEAGSDVYWPKGGWWCLIVWK